MARAGTRRRSHRDDAAARSRVIEATITTLREEGYAGASARAIAERGGFSQGLVFYHFGSMNELLRAALEETSRRRMQAYRDAIEHVDGVADLLVVAERVFLEDLDAGHLKVLAEIIAATSIEMELGDAVTSLIEPWITLTQEALDRTIGDTPLTATVSTRDAAFAIVALYLGLELLTHLNGDRSPAQRIFRTGRATAPILESIVGSTTSAVPREAREHHR